MPKNNGLFQAASGLSGGMSLSNDGNCGAFIGAGMILGSLCGRERNEFQDRSRTRRSKELVLEVQEKFKQECGSALCKDVKKAMEKDEDGCLRIVGKASAWTAEIILREFAVEE